MGKLDLPYQEREINGTTYRATTLPLEDWAALTESLADLIGDPLSGVLRGDAVLRRDLSGSDIGYLVAEIVSKLTKKRIITLTGHMAKGLRAGDHILSSSAQQTWWPKHMRDLASVVGLFLEAQYSDFFEGLGESLPQASQAAEDLSETDSD
jgi:hypothetical protein